MIRSESSSHFLLGRLLAAGMVLYGSTSTWALQGPPVSNHHHGGGGGSGNRGGGSLNAPEINPALIVGAIVLLVGVVLILNSRRARSSGLSRT